MDSEYMEKIKMFHRAYEIQQRITELQEKWGSYYPEPGVSHDDCEEWEKLSHEAHEYYMKDSREWISNRKQGILTGVLLVVLIESIIIAILTFLL